MKYYDRTQRKYRTVTVDPDGFIPPSYEMGDTDLECLQYKFFRLVNFPKTLLSVRCNTLIYGGSNRQI